MLCLLALGEPPQPWPPGRYSSRPVKGLTARPNRCLCALSSLPEEAVLLEEFKAFALRGNLLELAVAFILGVAFAAVVQALVDGVLMQLIAALVGRPDFDSLSFDLAGTPIRYGAFVTALVNFILIAFVLFWLVRAANRLMHPLGAPPEPPKTRECPYCFTPIALEATRCSACTSEVEPARA